MIRVAAELLPSACRIVAVRVVADRTEIIAAGSWSMGDADLVGALKRFRRSHKLTQDIRVAVWPWSSRRGVVNLMGPARHHADGPPSMTPVTARDASAPLVKAGYFVTDAIPAHRAVIGVGRRLDTTKALLMAINEDCGVLVSPSDAVVHFSWDPSDFRHHETRGLLTRYQFAAALSPQVRAMMKPRADAIVSFGGAAGLRSLVVPFIEEFDQEVVVVDQVEPDVAIHAGVSDDPDAMASWQTALAVALEADLS